MSLVAEQVEVQHDSAAYIKARNEGKSAEESRTVATKPTDQTTEPAKPAAEEPQQPRLPRSVKRELNRLREEIGSYKAKLELLEKQPAVKEQPKEDVEPRRADFAAGDEGTAQYLRAVQKWDKAQEAKTAGNAEANAEANKKLTEFLQSMDEKAAKDIEQFEDWAEVSKKASEDEDAPEFDLREHPVLASLLARSDMRAYVLYYWAHPENYASLEKILDMDDQAQISAFHRLEGRLERLYDADRSGEIPDKKAAQATESDKKDEPKDRRHLAEAARPGEPQQDGKPAKPKPSSSLSARGGEPVAEEPAIGSAAWMAKRNQATYGR